MGGWLKLFSALAEVAELADARDSKSRSFGSEGSIPSFGTLAQTALPRTEV